MAVAMSPSDLELFEKGIHYELYDLLGAHLTEVDGVHGTRFAVWAPNAAQVYVSGDFNDWQEQMHPMQTSGVWELFIPGVRAGAHYKFIIVTPDGSKLWKADPFAFASQLRPETASIVTDICKYPWARWEFKDRPVNIYEVHLGSWKQGLGYRELAIELAKYCKDLGFTHVEVLPITEHPLDESWGYQVSGFFAPTCRYGTPEDFQFFVDHLHQAGLGVILDWVPGHFPTDGFSLAQFDGTPLYEYHDPKMGYHPQWNTYIFDYVKPQVRNFLLASALFWFDKYNIDGIRIDAVESIIMRDFGRQDGEWIPNIHGGRENLEAIDFLQTLNAVVQERFPGRLICAEDSSFHPNMTVPTQEGGIGFSYKWGLGWMNDTLRFFHTLPEHRDLNVLAHIFTYIDQERFILPLSHDEVVHEKKSLLCKMPGEMQSKRAHLRLLYAWLYFCPGSKLLFMGGEFGQQTEWAVLDQLPWSHADNELKRCFSDLSHLWQAREWHSQCQCSIDKYLSLQRGQTVAVFNFSTEPIDDHFENQLFNSDCTAYGGNGREGLPPLTAIIYEQK